MTDFEKMAEAYLRQRVEMGEGVVYTSEPMSLVEGRRAGGQEGSVQVQRAAPSKPKAATPPGGAPQWAIDAPEIPGPGISVSLLELTAAPNAEYDALDLPQLVDRIAGCRDCALCEGRTKTVPGVGDPDADFMVVGEGPGQNEDEQGEPFVGRAGNLLDGILGSIGFERPAVYICNVVKCRPPKNRNPQPEEVAACIPYLYRQIELVRPKVILAVGAVAACALLGTKKSLGQMRTRVHDFRGIPLVVTYHPAALLRNPNWKRPTWDDVRIARRIFDSRS